MTAQDMNAKKKQLNYEDIRIEYLKKFNVLPQEQKDKIIAEQKDKIIAKYNERSKIK